MNVLENLDTLWDKVDQGEDSVSWDQAIDAAWSDIYLLLTYLQGARYRVDPLALDALMAPLLAEASE